MMKKRLLGLMLLLCVLAVGDVSAQTYSYTTDFDTLDAEWDLFRASHATGYLFNSSGENGYARIELNHPGGDFDMSITFRRLETEYYMATTMSIPDEFGGFSDYCIREWDIVGGVGAAFETQTHSCSDVPAGNVWLYVYFINVTDAVHVGGVSTSAPLANPVATPTPVPTATNEPSPTETPGAPSPEPPPTETPNAPSPEPLPTETATPSVTPEIGEPVTAVPPTFTPTPEITPEIGEPVTAVPPTPLPTEIGLPPVPVFTVTPFASADGRSITQTLPPGWGSDLPISMTMSGDFPPLPPPVDYQAFGTMDWQWDIAFGLEHFAMIISAARTLPLMITSLPYYPYVIFFLLILTAYKIIGRIIFTDSGASGEVPNQPRQGKGGS